MKLSLTYDSLRRCRVSLINTSLQRGDNVLRKQCNRFSGFFLLLSPIFILLFLLTGCCSTRHCDHAGKAVAKYHFETNSFQRALQARSEAPEEKIDLLVLSGGGSHGAWGAGVLRGWRENTGNPRPRKFPVVTGVSTGALLATYAFLGEPADYDLLEEAYTTAKTSDIYKKKFILFALFSDSLYNSKPLSKRVEKYITLPTLDRVALAGRKDAGSTSAP